MAPEERFDADATSALDEGGAGTAIGRYYLLQRIGEGGMGEVWLAEQKEPVHRRVALKLVKAGMNTREVIARFESERQALALMDHPAIAKVFDADSTPQGAPYFVMEYVAGVPITAYCDHHRLNTRERLELFMRVCEGVQHAHQKAIIHRDLKPSNILVTEVDGKPAPKIIDFGVAKALTHKLTADAMLTRVGAMIGTLEYMSPEQASSSGEDIDTRTDVYSLGVIFYELLAGVPPLELRQAALEETLRKLREDDAPKPSTRLRAQDPATTTELARKRLTEPRTLVKQLRGDLDAIALKALEKDRSRRYGSPSDFAADIGRYLNNEVVVAVPPSVAYRARKFAGRYRGALVTATAFVLVLLAAAVISIRQSIRARQESAIAQAVTDFLQKDLLGQASAYNQSKPDPNITVRTVLDRAAQNIEGKFGKQPEVEVAIRDTIGNTYSQLGLYDQARRQLEAALELGRHSLGPENPETLRTVSVLGRLAFRQGQYAESEKLFQQNLAVERRVLGPKHPDTLYSMENLGLAYVFEAKYKQAEPLLTQALEMERKVLGPEHPDTLKTMSDLAALRVYEGKLAEAEALQLQLMDLDRRVLGPDHPDTMRTMGNLATCYRMEGKLAEAEALSLQVVESKRRVLGPEHPDTLASTNSLAIIYRLEGKFTQAEALDQQVLGIESRVLGPEHPNTLDTMLNLANDYDREGKTAEAEALNRQVLDIRRRALGPDHPDTLMVMANLANDFAFQGDYSQAEALYRAILEVQQRTLGPDHPNTLAARDGLACIYREEGKYAQAEPLFRDAIGIATRKEGPGHPDTVSIVSDLAFMYQKKGDYAAAATYAEQALAGFRHALGAQSPTTANAEDDLGLAYISQGKFTDAEPLAREALSIDEKAQPGNWQRYRAESLLGVSLAGQKKLAEAGPLLREGYQGLLARKDLIDVPDRYHLDLAHQWLVEPRPAGGKPDKAAE